MTDNSWRQRHVGLAVAYNAWHFYQATADTGWFAGRGADLIHRGGALFQVDTDHLLRLFREDAPGRSSTEQATWRELQGARSSTYRR